MESNAKSNSSRWCPVMQAGHVLPCPPRHSRVAVLVVQTWNCEWHSSCYVCGPLSYASSGLMFAGYQVKTWSVVNSTRLHTKQQFNDLRFFQTLISADEISECVTVVCIHYSCDQCTDRICASEGEVCAGSARCCAHGEVKKAAQHVSLSRSRSNTLNALPPCVIEIIDV